MDTRESRMIPHYLQVNDFFPRNNLHQNEKLTNDSTLFTGTVRKLRENFKLRTCRIDQALGRLIWRCLVLKFSCKERTCEVNKLFTIWLFALSFLVCDRPVGITGE